MATKTLTLDPLLPDGTPAVGTRLFVSVDRDVAVTGEGVIAKAGAAKSYLVPKTGVFPTIPVIPNDDSSLAAWSKGYALLIEAEPTPNGGVTGSWTVAVTSANAAIVRLSDLPVAVTLPPLDSVSPAQITEAITDSANAVTTANNAEQLAQNANAGTDTGVAGLLNQSGSQTQVALWQNMDAYLGGSAANLALFTRQLAFNVRLYGAVGDGVADDTAAIQLALNQALAAGGTVFFPAGRYNITSTLTVDIRGITGLVTSTQRRVSITGAGRGSTLIRATADNVTILQFIGQSPLGTDSNGFCTISDVCFGGQTPTARTATGVVLTNMAAVAMERCGFIGLGQALVLDGCLSSRFSGLYIGYNANGVLAKGNASAPNSNTWIDCEFGNNTGIAYDGQTRVATGTFVNCRFEGNGTAGSGLPTIHQVSDGLGGEAGLVFIGTYTERNHDSAEFLLEGPTAGTHRVAFTFIGGGFTRSANPAPTNVIKTTGAVDLTISGATFTRYNGSTTSATTPVLNLSPQTRLNDNGNRYADSIEAPTSTTVPVATRAGWNVLSCLPLSLSTFNGGGLASGLWKFARFTIARPLTIKGLGIETAAAASGGTAALSFAIYAGTATGGGPGALLYDLSAQTLDLTAAAGVQTLTLTTPVSLPSGTYWVGLAWTGTATANPTIYAHAGNDPAVTAGAAGRNLSAYSQTSSTVPNPASATTGTSAPVVYYQQ